MRSIRFVSPKCVSGAMECLQRVGIGSDVAHGVAGIGGGCGWAMEIKEIVGRGICKWIFDGYGHF